MQHKQKIKEKKLKQNQKIFIQNKKDLKKLKREKKNGFLKTLIDFVKLEEKRYTLEDSIPYEKMYEDGICKVNAMLYNKMISFEDINYQLALEEARDMIFNQFTNFLNSFDPSVSIQFCFTNQLCRLQILATFSTLASNFCLFLATFIITNDTKNIFSSLDCKSWSNLLISSP